MKKIFVLYRDGREMVCTEDKFEQMRADPDVIMILDDETGEYMSLRY